VFLDKNIPPGHGIPARALSPACFARVLPLACFRPRSGDGPAAEAAAREVHMPGKAVEQHEGGGVGLAGQGVQESLHIQGLTPVNGLASL
jgi:hypothetical protein